MTRFTKIDFGTNNSNSFNSASIPRDIQNNADYAVADVQEEDFEELVDGTFDYSVVPLDDADGALGSIFVGTMNQAYRDIIPVSNLSAAQAFAVNKSFLYNGKILFTNDTQTHYYIYNGQVFPLIESTSKSYKTNRQDLSSNISLNNNSKSVQHLLNKSGLTLNISLPTSPDKDLQFIIKNRKDSTHSLYVNDVTLLPGEMWNGIWDGIEWMEI